MSEDNKIQEYNADSFAQLGELESIRINVPMYAGSDGIQGIEKLLGEVMENSKDEANPRRDLYNAGLTDELILKMSVELLPDGSAIIEDNGRGIPVDVNKTTGKPAVYMAFEDKHAGGKLRNMVNTTFSGSIGVHGIGLTLVNACSEFVDIRIKRGGKIYEMGYKNGGAERIELQEVGTCDLNDTGTRIHFLYDKAVMKTVDSDLGTMDYPFHIQKLKDKLVDYVTYSENFEIDFKYDTGELVNEEDFDTCQRGQVGEINYTKKDFSVENIIRGYSRDHEILLYEEDSKDQEYKLKMYYSFVESMSETVKITVVNGLKMINGSSVQRVLEDETFKFYETVMKNLRKLNNGYELTRNEVLNKLNYVIVLETNQRSFTNQAKSSYSNDEITQTLRQSFKDVLSELPPDIINRVIKEIEWEYREKIKKVQNYEKEKEKKLPRKNKRDTQEALKTFSDCRNDSSMKHKNRVWFMEGKSAATAFAIGRDANFEAYVPLKGKPLNVIKNSIMRTRFDHKGKKEKKEYEEFTLIRTIVDMKKFGAFIICTDADIDGLHIRNLLGYIFYKYFPEIILRGQLYLVEAPLFKMEKGNTVKYAYSDDESELLQKQGYKQTNRFKGLGSMGEEDPLYEILTREGKFVQLTMDDIENPLELLGDYLDEETAEEITSKNIIEYVAGKDASLRRQIAKDFMSDGLVRYMEKEKKLKSKFVSKVNPMYVNEDGTPMTQSELDMIYVEHELKQRNAK